jgi:hypothetical protein
VQDCTIRLLDSKSYNGSVALEAACGEVLTALHEFRAILLHTISATRHTVCAEPEFFKVAFAPTSYTCKLGQL